MEEDLLKRKVFLKKLIFIGFPMVLQSAISNLLNFIDNIMVGGLGTVAIEAVSIVNQIFFVYICVLCGTISGAGVFGTQFFGKKDYEGVKKIFQIKWIFSIFIILFTILVFYLLKGYIVDLYLHKCNADKRLEILNAVNLYLPFIVLSAIPFGIRKIYASTLNESGNTKITMYSSVVAVISNTILNYSLIYGKFGFPVLGIRGAAIATFISRCIEFFIVIIFSKQFTFFKSIYSNFVVTREYFLKITKNITPLILNTFLWSYSFSIVIQIYSLKNIDNIAIMSISTAFSYIFIDLLVAVGSTAEIILGHELGKNNFYLANILAKRILLVTFSIALFFSFIMYFYSFYFPDFYNVNAEIKNMATKCIQSFAVTFVFTTFVNTSFHILRAGGKTVLTTLFDSVFLWGIMMPVQFFLVKFTGLELFQIYFLVLFLQIVQVIIGYILISKKVWIQNLT